MKEKSKLSLISTVLTGLYLIYLFSHFVGSGASAASDAEQVGVAIASMIVLPHFLVTLVGFVFNLLGTLLHKRAFMLVAAILYSVAMIIFVPYFMFLVAQVVLMYVAYAKFTPKTI